MRRLAQAAFTFSAWAIALSVASNLAAYSYANWVQALA